MPMNPRLLRPRTAGNFATDADAKAYIEAVRTADGQYPERGVQVAIDSFVIGCKSDSIWTAIKSSCILMGARTLSGALTPLAGTAPTNLNFVTGDYNRKTGLIGNGSTKYLNTERASNADPRDSFHQSMYIATLGSGGSHLCGVNQDSGLYQLSTLYAFNRTSSVQNSSRTHVVGLSGSSRGTGSAFVIRGGGVNVTITAASIAPGVLKHFMFCTNNNGSPAAFWNGRLAFYSIGTALDLALLDTRVAELYSAIGGAIQ